MKKYEKSIITIMLVSTLSLFANLSSMSANVSARTTNKILSSTVRGFSTVRGKIERKGDSKIYPASYVRVTLAPKAKRTSSISAYTGSDGMYYFRVPAGAYILEVWNAEGKAIKKYNIIADRQYVDLPPIQID